MGEAELVLKLGVEGGGAAVFRTPHGTDGWQFHVEGTSMYLDENDDEGWRSWRSPSVQTLGEALSAIADDGSWVLFHPITVHTDYRAAVWELARAAADKLPEGDRELWDRRSRDWRRLCQQES
jgi:hypothetical protein